MTRSRPIAASSPLDRLIACGAPDAEALVAPEGSYSYAALDVLVSRVAGGLLAAGVRPGDRVASWIGKTLAAAVLPFACWRAGLVHVPVNPALKAPQVAHILADSGAVLLITGRARLESLEPMAGVKRLCLEEDWTDLADHAPAAPASPDADALAALLYTSGSTGRPKGVMVSHANLWLGAEAVADYLRLSPRSRVLALLPLSFDYGLSQLLSTLHAGGTVILHDYALPQHAVRAIARHRVTGLAGVPPLWTQLLEIDWPDEARLSLEHVTNSGGHLPEPMVKRMTALFPNARLYLMYGLTEAFRSTYLDPDLVAQRPGSIGKAIPHAEILVVRPDGSLTDDGERGELVHCGPLVAQGYWNDPVRTAERFRPAPPASVYGGTAVWSGDIAVRDKDGFLSFVGRNDEMIKTAGNRVSPTEVEEAALATGAVRECAAFGVPDARLGQAILLVASPAAGMAEAEAETALGKGLRQALPNFMVPAHVMWRDALPRTPNGKIDRARLRAELV